MLSQLGRQEKRLLIYLAMLCFIRDIWFCKFSLQRLSIIFYFAILLSFSFGRFFEVGLQKGESKTVCIRIII